LINDKEDTLPSGAIGRASNKKKRESAVAEVAASLLADNNYQD